MANCARCGRKTGGFSFRSLNNTTGRCDECDKEVGERLVRFRKYFQELSANGTLSKFKWAALENLANDDRIELKEALAYTRGDVLSLVSSILEKSREEKGAQPQAEADSEYVKRVLEVPAYYVEEIQNLVSEAEIAAKNDMTLGIGNAAIVCIKCGAGVIGPASASQFSCATCGLVAIIRRCPFCAKPVHIQQGLWGRRVKCLPCGQEKSWGKWDRREVTLGGLAKNYNAAPEIIADPSRRIVSGMVI